MNRHRLAIAWIACFAVLFNMLAMPMTGAMAQAANSPAEQLLWSSFCTGSGTKMVAINIGTTEQKPRPTIHIRTCSIAGAAQARRHWSRCRDIRRSCISLAMKATAAWRQPLCKHPLRASNGRVSIPAPPLWFDLFAQLTCVSNRSGELPC